MASLLWAVWQTRDILSTESHILQHTLLSCWATGSGRVMVSGGSLSSLHKVQAFQTFGLFSLRNTLEWKESIHVAFWHLAGSEGWGCGLGCFFGWDPWGVVLLLTLLEQQPTVLHCWFSHLHLCLLSIWKEDCVSLLRWIAPRGTWEKTVCVYTSKLPWDSSWGNLEQIPCL